MIDTFRGDEKYWECFESLFDNPLVSESSGKGETSKPSLEVNAKECDKEVITWEQS